MATRSSIHGSGVPNLIKEDLSQRRTNFIQRRDADADEEPRRKRQRRDADVADRLQDTNVAEAHREQE